MSEKGQVRKSMFSVQNMEELGRLYEGDTPVLAYELNTTEPPASSNAFDSLGEAYRKNGEKVLAIDSYQTAVKLDPSNGHAAAMLKELK